MITVDSFGSECPGNWEEIADFLNSVISERGIEDDRDALDQLWEGYCSGELEGAPEPLKLCWYAYMYSNDDDDWGTGTYNRGEATEWLAEARKEYPDAYIAVIDGSVCVGEIRE